MKLRTLFEPAEQVLIFEDGIRIESYLRIWHNNRWYLRYAVCERRTQTSPAVFVVYKNEDHYQKRNHGDVIVLNNYIGFEYGFRIKNMDRTLAIILSDLVLTFAFRHIKNMVFWKEWLKDVCGRSVIFYMRIKEIPESLKAKSNAENMRIHLTRDVFELVQGSPPRPLSCIPLKDLVDVECVDDTITFKTLAIRSAKEKDEFFWFTSVQVPELELRLKRLLESKQFQKKKTEHLIKPEKTLHRNLSLQNNLNVNLAVKKDPFSKEYVNSTFPRGGEAKDLNYVNAEIIQNAKINASQPNLGRIIHSPELPKKLTSTSIPSFKVFMENAAKSRPKVNNQKLYVNKPNTNSRKISTAALQDSRYQNWIKATKFVKALRKKSLFGVSKSTEAISKRETDYDDSKEFKKSPLKQMGSEDSTSADKSMIFPNLNCTPATFMDPVNSQRDVPSGLIKIQPTNKFNMGSFGNYLAKKLRTSIKGSYSRYDGERTSPDFQDEEVETSSKFGAIDCAIKRGQERLRRSDRRNSGFPVRSTSRTGTISSDTSSLAASEMLATPLAQSYNQTTMPSMYAIEERSSVTSSVTLAKDSQSTILDNTISISYNTIESSKGSNVDAKNHNFEVVMSESTLSLPAQNYDLPSPSFSVNSSMSVQSEMGPGIAFSRNGSHRRSKQKQLERFFTQIVIPPELPPRKYTVPAMMTSLRDSTDARESESKSRPSLEYLHWSSFDSENNQPEIAKMSSSSSPKKISFVSENVNYVDISNESFPKIQNKQEKQKLAVKSPYYAGHMMKSTSMFTLDRRRSSARQSNDVEDTKSARDSPSFIKSISSLLSRRYRNTSNNSTISSPNSFRFAFQ